VQHDAGLALAGPDDPLDTLVHPGSRLVEELVGQLTGGASHVEIPADADDQDGEQRQAQQGAQ
jgi:hypothetical protein